MLDGDAVRARLGGGLGFSLADRGANVERLGWVAAEVARHGGTALGAPIMPADGPRVGVIEGVRGAGGGVLRVHVAARLSECAARDVKGLYRAAGRVFSGGSSKGGGGLDLEKLGNDLTGLSHPYELPTGGGGAHVAHVTLDTGACTVEEGVAAIVAALGSEGYVSLQGSGTRNITNQALLESEATAEELALMRALQDGWEGGAEAAAAAASAGSPLSPGVAAWVRTAAALQAVYTGSQADPGARLCSAGWDVFEGVSSTGEGKEEKVAMRGGLPMAGSPTSLHIRLAGAAAAAAAAAQPGPAAASASSSGAVEPAAIQKGAAPSSLRFVIAPHAAGFEGAASALRASGVPLALLSHARVAAAEASGAAEAARPAGSAARPPQLPAAGDVPPLFVPPSPRPAAALLMDPWLLQQGNEGGAGSSFTQPPSASLYAAFDLWTAMRWSGHYAPVALRAAMEGGGGMEEGGQPPALIGIAHPRLLALLPHFLRLDPCATALIVLPKLGAAGTRPGKAVDAPALAAALQTQLAAEAGVGAGVAGAAAEGYVRAALAAAQGFPQRVELLFV